MSRVRKSGGYRELRTFQSATLIYDATYWFCEKYCGRYSRMIDQTVQAVRRVAGDHQSDWSDPTDQQRAMLYAEWLEHDDPFVRANALICLIHQTNYLLDRQIAALEKQFVEEGGYSEQLAAKRLQHRSDQKDQTDQKKNTETALWAFSGADLRDNALALLNTLGYQEVRSAGGQTGLDFQSAFDAHNYQSYPFFAIDLEK